MAGWFTLGWLGTPGLKLSHSLPALVHSAVWEDKRIASDYTPGVFLPFQ